MTHIYQLDLATMLTLLAEQTGHLYTTGILLPGIQSSCEVVVSVLAGQVQECRVTSQKQVLLTAGHAIQTALALGVLSWTYTPDEPPLSPPALLRHTSDHALIVPQRTRVVSPSELATWPRLHRLLYQLTDSRHTVDQLAHLLSQPLDVVMAGVTQLQQQGVFHLASQQEAVRQRFSAFLPSLNER